MSIIGWAKLYDSTLSSAATSVTISGLAGDTDVEYKLEARIVNGYNGEAYYTLTFNTDTGANYGYQYINGVNTTTSATRSAASGMVVGSNDAINKLSLSEMKIHAKSGYLRTAINEHSRSIATTTVTSIHEVGYVWNNTTDNITQMVITSDGANGLGIGTQLTLWGRKTMTTTPPTTLLEWVTP